MKDIVIPQLDSNEIQEKANEYAMEGAMKALKEFYTGYNSPYQKAIRENLEGKEVVGIDIPDIIGILNESLSNEVDSIANTAVSKSYVSLIKQFFTRAEDEIKFSEILQEFVTITQDYGYDGDFDFDDYEVEVEETDKHSWLDVTIGVGDYTYRMTLHTEYLDSSERKKLEESGGKPRYNLYNLPTAGNGVSRYTETMTLKVNLDDNEAKLEMPFTRDILKDKFMSFLSGLVIARTKIIIDTKYFDEGMMPDHECYCD